MTREETIDALEQEPLNLWDIMPYYDTIIEALKEPPRVHAHWTALPDIGWECLRCGYVAKEDEHNYCPNCGAKMDEVE